MTFADILSLALKIILCAGVMYVIAGFIVSLKHLLPFLAIADAITIIILLFYVRENGVSTTMIVVLIALSLMMMLCYFGDGYMNPVVHENLYTLVNVERKWNSWFAEYDDYELHFSPVETGGFFANTAIYGLLFGFYYVGLAGAPESTVIGFAVSAYIICMSILDIIFMFGGGIGGILHWFLHGLIIIFSVSILFWGGDGRYESIQTEATYKKCAEYAVMDFNKSYKLEYEHYKDDENGYTQAVEKRFFMYDANIDVAAFYNPNFRESASKYDDEYNIYTTVYMKEYHNPTKVSKFTNLSDVSNYEFELTGFATPVDTGYKYMTFNEDLISYGKFDRTKFFQAYQIGRNKDKKELTVYYNQYLGDSNYKHATYTFKTNNKEKPIALLSITTRFETEDESRILTYIPLSGETPLDEITYDNGTKLYGYSQDEDFEPDFDGGYGIDVMPLINELKGEVDVVANYDFTITRNNGSWSSMYVYDSETEVSVLYANSDYELGLQAIEANDFESYKPNYYIDNIFFNMLDSAGQLVDVTGQFEKYTAEYLETTEYAMYVFYDFSVDTEVEFVEDGYGDVVASFMAERVDVLDIDITYAFSCKSVGGVYMPYKITAMGLYEGNSFELTLYLNDVFDIEITV